MSTSKMGFWRWALASATILVVAAGSAQARVIDPTGVTTTERAGMLIYPKLKVDLNTCNVDGTCSLLPQVSCTDDSDCQPTCGAGFVCNLTADTCAVDADCPGAAMDTMLQLTNASEFLTSVHCFYTNTNGHCSNSPTTICNPSGASQGNFPNLCPSGGTCIPGWQETDFHMTLTKRQPVSWSVYQGLAALPLANEPGPYGQENEGNIPPVPEVPFTGELLCVEVDDAGLPVLRNDLKGEATTVRTIIYSMDTNEYNAIGIKAIADAAQPTNVLKIGGPDAQYGIFDNNIGKYVGCPNVITMNHFFDGANVVSHEETVQGEVNSTLTMTPCARDYLNQTAGDITVQFLVYNEFEQRFSTSTRVNCYKEVQLSDIDTRPGPGGNAFSIFAVGVEGTLTGFTRIRSVAGSSDGVNPNYDARSILPLLTENWASGTCSVPPTGEVVLCETDSDCLLYGGVCLSAGISTDTANVQWQGGPRENATGTEQGDLVILP